MAVPLEKFVEQLEDSGIIAGDTLKDFLPPQASPTSAEELALELVRKNKLTTFQAEEVSKGRGKSLVLGNYVLMEKIGAGGMGQVFKAQHRVMERVVAVKLLPSTMTQDTAAIARFHREVKAAAKLRHPNIIAADDADQANGIHFLVMEFVDGKDLSVHVKKNGPFSVDNAVNYILQAARGLEFAHEEGVVHRDIKPANLLIDKKGTVKILDMGLARIHGDGAQAELTSTGAVMGTVDYMAPEQALNTKTADARADIYALGCSLYYLLTGKSTYDGDTMMAKMLAHRDAPIPDLHQIGPHVPERLDRVFQKMVAKQIEDRYQTMTEVIVALEGCMNSDSASQFIRLSLFDQTITEQLSGTLSQTVSLPPSNKSISRSIRSSVEKRLMMIGGGALGFVILLAIVGYGYRPRTGNPTASTKPVQEQQKPVEEQQKPIQEQQKPIQEQEQPVVKQPVTWKRPWDAPEFKEWMEEVATMPAERQIKAVSTKLVDLNPKFDGKMRGSAGGYYDQERPTIKKGVVTQLFLRSDDVTDLSPIRAFVGLTVLKCTGTHSNSGELTDLSPLDGMKSLKILNVSDTHVSDLTPLKGLDLEILILDHTKVSDLTPLEGMTSLKELVTQCSWDVSSLSPLKGLSLRNLNLLGNKVRDLTPLKGMTSLTVLKLDQTRVTDLSPLEDLKLTEFLVTPKNITKGMEVIRKMETLKTIGLDYKTKFPADEFWKKYDAGEFGKPQ